MTGEICVYWAAKPDQVRDAISHLEANPIRGDLDLAVERLIALERLGGTLTSYLDGQLQPVLPHWATDEEPVGHFLYFGFTQAQADLLGGMGGPILTTARLDPGINH